VTVEALLARLDRVRRSGDGWMARCPAHEDTTPSLSLAVGESGRPLVHCFAGCTPDAILRALGLTTADLGIAESRTAGTANCETYDYVDEQGRQLFQVVRLPPKRFRIRRHNPGDPASDQDGWAWNLGGCRQVLFRLDVITAADSAETVYVCEGEKDVIAIERAGGLGTTNPMGAGKWRDDYSSVLARLARVVVVADDDAPGRQHARAVAASLRRYGCPVDVVLPRAGKDASDHFAAGHSISEFRPLPDDPRTEDDLALTALTVDAILAANPDLTKAELLKGNPRLASLLGARETPAQRLVRLTLESGSLLFHDEADRAYIRVVDVVTQTWPLRSRRAKLHLRHLAHHTGIATTAAGKASARRAGRPPETPSSQAVSDAVAQLEALALFEGEEMPVYLRVASEADVIHVDLGDDGRREVTITAEGWSVNPHAVCFRRGPGMAPLPEPTSAGDISELRAFLNLASNTDLVLVVAWLLGTLRPGQPMPLLVLSGEQGSAKSSAARIVRALVDPSPVSLRSIPRDERDLMISTQSGFVMSFDNISGLGGVMSDALCRLSTGGGFATRQLFTDDEEILFDARRPVILNGIESVAASPDLLDRSLLVALPTIDPTSRRAEAELFAEFDQALPRLTAALYDAATYALVNLARVELSAPPRMADFARWVTAAEPAFGWPAGTFRDAYELNRASSHEVAIEGSTVGALLLAIADEGFDGTPTRLLELLTERAGDSAARSREFPKTPRALSALLRRLAPNLRGLGVQLDHYRQPGGHRTRMWRIRRDP
jgi:putative DNA primase/helicase